MEMKKNGVRRRQEPFASWTSDKKAVELFLPSETYRKVAEYGILIEVPFEKVKNYIAFSLDPYFKDKIEKQMLVDYIFKYYRNQIDKLLEKEEFNFKRNNILYMRPQMIINAFAIHEYILKTIPFDTPGLKISLKDLK
jgi:hypothetical protein